MHMINLREMGPPVDPLHCKHVTITRFTHATSMCSLSHKYIPRDKMAYAIPGVDRIHPHDDGGHTKRATGKVAEEIRQRAKCASKGAKQIEAHSVTRREMPQQHHLCQRRYTHKTNTVLGHPFHSRKVVDLRCPRRCIYMILPAQLPHPGDGTQSASRRN